MDFAMVLATFPKCVNFILVESMISRIAQTGSLIHSLYNVECKNGCVFLNFNQQK